jgi:glycosyltransferase involved in cell wall biosynthesis
MRDNAAAAALLRAGHDVLLVPLYTPLKTDEPYVGTQRVLYGAVNVFLQHASRAFARMPESLRGWLDRPAVLGWVSRLAGATSPRQLGALTVDVLRGPQGTQAAALEQLLEFLDGQPRPDVLHLPNLLFLGLARPLRRALGVPLVCTLSGEDGFVESLPEPYRGEAIERIRRAAGEVGAFVATSRWMGQRAVELFGLPAGRVQTVWTGINAADFAAGPQAGSRPPTVGFLARICPMKGLDVLVEAFDRLAGRPEMQQVHLKVAGYLGPADRKWFDKLRARVRRMSWADRFVHVGEVDRPGKIDFLRSLDCFSVPTRHPEAKGVSVLEAMAAGVPVVQPAHGCFPELLEDAGGGMLVPPADPQALADALHGLLGDHPGRDALARAGRDAVQDRYTTEHMADRLLAVYREVIG